MEINLERYDEFVVDVIGWGFDLDNLVPYINLCHKELQRDDVRADFHCTKGYEYNIEIANHLIECRLSREKRLVLIFK
jgi:hypothetical protein